MNHMVIHYGLATEQASLLGSALPEEYELTTAECVTDLIVTNAMCTVIDAANMGEDALRPLLAYYMDVGDRLDETVVWLGNANLPDLSSFVSYDNFLELLTELDSILTKAQVCYDAMQMYGGEYAHLPKRAIEEGMEADIQTQVHRKYGENPDPMIADRLRKELTALREVDGFPDLAAAFELSRWLKTKNIPFFVEYITASGLIPYLLGITQTNPLPPHTFCLDCKKMHWHPAYKDGFDIPAAVCPECSTALVRDGHDLVWQEYCSYGRIPTYGFWLPASMREQINGWLTNHWLRPTWEEIWGPAKIDKCRIDTGPFYFIFALEEGQFIHKADLQQPSIVLPDEIYREDVYHYLRRHGFSEKDAFRGMNRVRKGRGFPVITDGMRTAEDSWFFSRCEMAGWLPSKAANLERFVFQSRIKQKP